VIQLNDFTIAIGSGTGFAAAATINDVLTSTCMASSHFSPRFASGHRLE
jgi:ATP-dependent protease HslVU (ClpYQ) peptidase subunit